MTITLTREEAQRVLDAMIRIRWAAGERDKKNRIRDFDEAMDVSKEAIETLRARLSAPEPEYRDVVIKGDLWRIEFLPDHAASVVLVRANYEAQPEPPCKTGSQCIGGKCPQCVVREWQGLTDAEVEQIVDDYWHDVDMFIESIEAKLKEKNASNL